MTTKYSHKHSLAQDMLKMMLICFSLVIVLPVVMSSFSADLAALASGTAAGGSGNVSGSTVIKSTGYDKTVISKVLCNVLFIVSGTAGKTFAAFAIVSVGIGFFTGKVSWGLMVGVAAGIAAIFGAPSIVAAVAGGSSVQCGTDVGFSS